MACPRCRELAETFSRLAREGPEAVPALAPPAAACSPESLRALEGAALCCSGRSGYAPSSAAMLSAVLCEREGLGGARCVEVLTPLLWRVAVEAGSGGDVVSAARDLLAAVLELGRVQFEDADLDHLLEGAPSRAGRGLVQRLSLLAEVGRAIRLNSVRVFGRNRRARLLAAAVGSLLDHGLSEEELQAYISGFEVLASAAPPQELHVLASAVAMGSLQKLKPMVAWLLELAGRSIAVASGYTDAAEVVRGSISSPTVSDAMLMLVAASGRLSCDPCTLSVGDAVEAAAGLAGRLVRLPLA